MTHLGFIAASYAIAVAVTLVLGLDAARRLATARRRLAAIDKRGER